MKGDCALWTGRGGHEKVAGIRLDCFAYWGGGGLSLGLLSCFRKLKGKNKKYMKGNRKKREGGKPGRRKCL
jgi:hypothetical protein